MGRGSGEVKRYASSVRIDDDDATISAGVLRAVVVCVMHGAGTEEWGTRANLKLLFFFLCRGGAARRRRVLVQYCIYF